MKGSKSLHRLTKGCNAMSTLAIDLPVYNSAWTGITSISGRHSYLKVISKT
ncbi:MAG TPA: hypothetical protein ACFYEC_06685 [Candidatus Brocadiaceae bacterium]